MVDGVAAQVAAETAEVGAITYVGRARVLPSTVVFCETTVVVDWSVGRSVVAKAAHTARRENEFRSVERKLDCMRRAGLDDTEAARYDRVFADLVLAYSAMDASLACLSPELRDGDLGAWKTDYLALPADKYPNIARVAPRFPALEDPDNFVTAVRAVIDTVRATAVTTAKAVDGSAPAGSRHRES